MIFKVKLVAKEDHKKGIWVTMPTEPEEIAKAYSFCGSDPQQIQIMTIECSLEDLEIIDLDRYTAFELNRLAQNIDKMDDREKTWLCNHSDDIFCYEDWFNVVRVTRLVAHFNKEQSDIFEALLYHGIHYSVAHDIMVDNGYRVYVSKSDREVGEKAIYDIGGIGKISVDTLIKYFDYKAYGAAIKKEKQLLDIPGTDKFVEIL